MACVNETEDGASSNVPYTTCGIAMGFWDCIRSRLEREVEAQRKELTRALELPDDGKRVAVLRQLATELGASTIKMHPGHGYADQPELVYNIQQALQTKAMIAAVRTSSNYLIVTVLLTIIASLSMVAAWIAALRMPGGS